MFTGVIAVSVVAAMIILFIVSAILMWLWNITIPDIFKLRAIGYWEAMRLVIICGILFGAPYASFSSSV